MKKLLKFLTGAIAFLLPLSSLNAKSTAVNNDLSIRVNNVRKAVNASSDPKGPLFTNVAEFTNDQWGNWGNWGNWNNWNNWGNWGNWGNWRNW